MTISTIVLAITGIFGGRQGDRRSSIKRGEDLKKWLDRLADTIKRLVGKTVEALPAIVGFVAEHAWALIVFVEGFVGVWWMQMVKKS